MNGKLNVLPVMVVAVVAVLIVSAVMSCPIIYATDAETSTVVRNAAPTVDIDLTPDDDPATPGVQVINPDPATNKTVTITATVTDVNGYDDLTGVVIANITGPSTVEDSPVNLSFYHTVNVTTARYEGSFNMSSHLEGDYKVEVNATDKGRLTGVGSENFSYSYGAPPDTTPPVVTNPSANPSLILADGTQECQLNVTVTDESGIYSVTVDLTEIGGLAAEEMTNIPGTDIYTINTTAAVGTSPGTYYLSVNGTDNSPNRNSNTSVSIPLTVLPPEVVTTYDYRTGAGTDKWAYRYQHNEKPPSMNDVPSIEFVSEQYNRISQRDWRMLIDRTDRRGNYATHRFKINIDQPADEIIEMNIAWNGVGYGFLGKKGASLYVWNYTAGNYEILDRDNRFIAKLNGELGGDLQNYLSDGNIIFVVEQNSPLRSILGTDYLKLEVVVHNA